MKAMKLKRKDAHAEQPMAIANIKDIDQCFMGTVGSALDDNRRFCRCKCDFLQVHVELSALNLTLIVKYHAIGAPARANLDRDGDILTVR